MLITNYFQVRSSSTVQSELIEKLKLENEENSNNVLLQEQIRELDLLARNAYFINLNKLKTGIAILLGMAVVFVVFVRIYFTNCKNIPEKEIDPIDDWFIKSKTRKYVVLITIVLAAGALLFAVLTSPYFNAESRRQKAESRMQKEEGEMQNAESGMQDEEVGIDDDLTINETDTTENNSQFSIFNSQLNVSHNGFRGDHSLGVSSAKNIPTSWDLSTNKNILWKVSVPLQGFNSPVINGNRVFFSGADEKSRVLFCYELSSGKQLWSLEAKNIPGSPSSIPKIQDDTGLAASTVATNGKQVCAIFATGDIICANMEGKQIWAKNIGVPDNPYGYASSLLIYDNLLFIQYDNHNAKKVMALDVATGNLRWSKERAEKNPSWSSPVLATVNNKPQLILMGNPGITSYNPNTGEENWRVGCMSGEPAPSPAFSNGTVYVATEYAAMTAINATDGSILWTTDEFLPEIASPLATKDFVLVATSYGVVATYHAQTGELIKTMEFNTDFNASPILVDGKIYLFCTNGKVFILSAKSDFSLINSFETGEKMFATPAFTDGKIVVKTEKSIYCVQL